MLRTCSFKSQNFSVTIHHFNIHSFAIEMLKVTNNIALTIFDFLIGPTLPKQGISGTKEKT